MRISLAKQAVKQARLRITILIPCHNEEKSIRSCVQACLQQSRAADEIIVVNDGSTDASLEILRSFKQKIKLINLPKASGNKSFAQEYGLKFVSGDVFISTDADTLLHPDFVAEIEKSFADPGVAAVGGYVKSIRYNWLTACRAHDYIIGQNIHKLAQSKLNFVLVIPGAAGAFRTDVFRQFIGFDHDTLTEDLDFTYKLHRRGLRVAYNPKAIVYTQDPVNLRSYVNQMRRWFCGGWQNLMKHLSVDFVSDPRRALELSLMYVEGIVFSLLLLFLPLVNLWFALQAAVVLMAIIFGQSLYATLKEKRSDILPVTLYYWVVLYVNAYVFLEQFVKEVLLKKRNRIWLQPERISI